MVNSESGIRSDPVFLQPPVEGAARQAERAGGFADVSPKSRHSFLDQYAFYLLEAHLFEVAGGLRLAAQAELGRPDRRAGGEKHGALDRMVELTHIPRPRMVHERLKRRALEGGNALLVAARVD